MGFAELRLGINLVSYKSPLDFISNFGSSFGEGIGLKHAFHNRMEEKGDRHYRISR